jgi:PH (Pleckstrin Homology) domain-containing protein
MGAAHAGGGAMTESASIRVRPVRTARIAVVAAVLVAVVFVICAVLLPHTTDGVNFTPADQFGIAGTGLLIAVGILSMTRPRLHADLDGLDVRSFFGSYRHVDWDLVTAVEFPPKARFARLVLPGDELIALYAVQRADTERSVAVMRDLRALHAATR